MQKPEVLFEDNHLLALFKPAGMATQPAIDIQEESLEEWGKEYLKKKWQKPGNVFLHAAHRLDRPVSGIVLFAKTSKALSRLNESLRDRLAKKTYLAAVSPPPTQKKEALEHYLVRGRPSHKDDPKAQHATLSYEVLKTKDRFALLIISLGTGRYHQIRAQLSLSGHPIVGDHTYRSHQPFPQGIALHHHRFIIPHPTLKTLLTIKSPVPSSWSDLPWGLDI
ncbi:MAG: rluA [Chlamydiales bacterium]|jgi:23S rRNA pseudouridine1911/1915/1917 synthase|nr:rluA [Chlamydiales bacterium]